MPKRSWRRKIMQSSIKTGDSDPRMPSPLPEVVKSTAGAPVLASDNKNPAAPSTGRALLRRFLFEP